MANNKKAAVYARCNFDDPLTLQLRNQLQAVENYAKENDITIAQIFVDGDSPKSMHQLGRIFTESQSGYINSLIIHDIGMLSVDDSILDAINNYAILRLNGLQIFVVDNVDSTFTSSTIRSVEEFMQVKEKMEAKKLLDEKKYQARRKLA